jgi:hypothetical protein
MGWIRRCLRRMYVLNPGTYITGSWTRFEPIIWRTQIESKVTSSDRTTNRNDERPSESPTRPGKSERRSACDYGVKSGEKPKYGRQSRRQETKSTVHEEVCTHSEYAESVNNSRILRKRQSQSNLGGTEYR